MEILNGMEKSILNLCIDEVLNCTSGEFGYADDMIPEAVKLLGLSKNQVKGYLSQLAQKGMIYVHNDEFKTMHIKEKALNYATHPELARIEFL